MKYCTDIHFTASRALCILIPVPPSINILYRPVFAHEYVLLRKAVEAAIHSTGGLQRRDQRLAEWKSKAYSLSNAEARALSTRLLDGKEVRVCDKRYTLLHRVLPGRMPYALFGWTPGCSCVVHTLPCLMVFHYSCVSPNRD